MRTVEQEERPEGPHFMPKVCFAEVEQELYGGADGVGSNRRSAELGAKHRRELVHLLVDESAQAHHSGERFGAFKLSPGPSGEDDGALEVPLGDADVHLLGNLVEPVGSLLVPLGSARPSLVTALALLEVDSSAAQCRHPRRLLPRRLAD